MWNKKQRVHKVGKEGVSEIMLSNRRKVFTAISGIMVCLVAIVSVFGITNEANAKIDKIKTKTQVLAKEAKLKLPPGLANWQRLPELLNNIKYSVAWPDPFNNQPDPVLSAHGTIDGIDTYVGIFRAGGATLFNGQTGKHTINGVLKTVLVTKMGDIVIVTTGGDRKSVSDAGEKTLNILSPGCNVTEPDTTGKDNLRNPNITDTPIQYRLPITVTAKTREIDYREAPLLFSETTLKALTGESRKDLIPKTPYPPSPPSPPEKPEFNKTINVPRPDFSGPGCGWGFLEENQPKQDVGKINHEANQLEQTTTRELAQRYDKYYKEWLEYEKQLEEWETKAKEWLVFQQTLLTMPPEQTEEESEENESGLPIENNQQPDIEGN